MAWKADWAFDFNLVKTYLENMERMMSCVLKLGIITKNGN